MKVGMLGTRTEHVPSKYLSLAQKHVWRLFSSVCKGQPHCGAKEVGARAQQETMHTTLETRPPFCNAQNDHYLAPLKTFSHTFRNIAPHWCSCSG